MIIGLLGKYGVIGPTFEKSIFGETWVFSPTESWGYLFFGVISLVAIGSKSVSFQSFWAILTGLGSITMAILSIFNVEFLGIIVNRPMDILSYTLIAAWAIASTKDA